MSMKLSKRKRPLREDKPFTALPKIADKVFDDKTVAVLVRFLNAGTIKSVDYPIAMGKEAVVFRCTGPNGFVATKVYRYETTAFRSFRNYIEGDPRFSGVSKQLRPMIREWARKEYANLKICERGGVLAPKPLAHKENVVIMEFLGEKGIPYPKLIHAEVTDPEKLVDEVVENMRKMHRAGLVHADLSAYNIMLCRRKPYFIDISQSVLLSHPMAGRFLERDTENVLKFFEKLGVKRDKDQALEFIKEKVKEKTE